MNQLDQWLDFLEKGHPKTIDLGLERVRATYERFGESIKIPIITVAGTNGKGSTVAILAKLLKEAGLRVGTYTSPHLLKFNERIQMNGIAVSDETLCGAFQFVKVHQKESLTFFEYTTLAALHIFHTISNELDIIILEIGLGGRLDAVNIVSPNLAIITSIDFDHQEYLGETLAEIAFAKAGIIRENIPVILGKTACLAPIVHQANLLNSKVFRDEQEFGFVGLTAWQFDHHQTQMPSCALPKESVSLASAAYTMIGEKWFSLPPISHVANSLKGVAMVGRAYQVTLDNKITLVLDVAHNPMGSKWLANEMTKNKNTKIIAVWASLADKALTQIVKPMKALVDRWHIGYLTDVARATPVNLLEKALQQEGIENIFTHHTIKEAFVKAVECAQKNDTVLVFGSFFTVSQVLSTLGFNDRALCDNGLGIL